MTTLRALVFDAYGTLYDVHSVVATAETLWPGRGTQLSTLWRTKQLEYTWQRSLMGRYEDFGRVTRDSLAYACAALALPCADAQRERLLAAYLALAPFPEVPAALRELRGLRLAILSNGSPAMLDPLVANSPLRDSITDVLSVDAVKVFKPDPRVYRLAVDRLGVSADAIGFVSSNCWDAIGARSFGFRTFWINRAGAPVDEMGFPPDAQVKSLAELPALVSQ
jgi:2-haloacid dehalogenase